MHKITIPVTVVIPCFCCSDTINRAVDSVISQTVIPSELILVHDASNDGGETKRELDRLIDFNHISGLLNISLISLQKNSGPALARNVGWDHAGADYVAFLDADDAWHPLKLEMQYKWMKLNEKVDVSAHQSTLYSNNLKCVDKIFLASQIRFKQMMFSNLIQTRTVMLKRNLLFRFDEAMRYGEDYDLWIKMMSAGANFFVSNQSLSYIFRSEFSKGGLSSNLLKMEHAELHTIYQLYFLRKINSIIFLAASLWSIIKFLRRVTKKLAQLSLGFK